MSDDYLYKVVDALDIVAAETGKSVPQVALNWLLQRPTVSSVIIGARDEEQLRQNLAAEGWNLTAEQEAALDRGERTAARPILTGINVNFRIGTRCRFRCLLIWKRRRNKTR